MSKVFFGIGSFSQHMSSEGWQLQIGLQNAGYNLVGPKIDGCRNVRHYLEQTPQTHTVILQDKREWDINHAACLDKNEMYSEYTYLADRDDLFTLTVYKDAQNQTPYHLQSAKEIGCNALIIYYHPMSVTAVAPWVQDYKLIRTYHTINVDELPGEIIFNPKHKQKGCIVSGAISGHYPLRLVALNSIKAARHSKVSQLLYVPHPGYHARGFATPKYLGGLNHFRVALCCASRYQYALRKIIEATAVGCKVITDLAEYDRLPEIDDNLIRVPSHISAADLDAVVADAIQTWDGDTQRKFSDAAIAYYDHKNITQNLSANIEAARLATKVLKTEN